MNADKTLFAQVMGFTPWPSFSRISQAREGILSRAHWQLSLQFATSSPRGFINSIDSNLSIAIKAKERLFDFINIRKIYTNTL